ncbi:protein FAR1-RELATED SEQUENCE 5-like [Macadamia integrifolia]|uniref:protein FAR1-RELATED SEQUENCE 5-like n=1 Tax=Macadamia integrifolia TaxID=60698 RepID=UPI001C4FBB7C|nr:protein FAR1-RELATED SEQUENCE 5-like [Macadamia integrifolia]
MENVCMNDASEPEFGMLFNSEQDAYDYYNSYGRAMGFSVRRHFVNKSKKDNTTITSRGFVCSKAGFRLSDKRDVNIVNPRAETRTNCEARMNIYLVDEGKYKCRDFVREHNHELHTTSTVHMMRSQRNMLDIHRYEIDLADDSGIRPRSTVELMGRHAGGIENLSYMTQDVKNYLRTKRQRALTYGEAGSLMKYFVTQTRNNPSFTYSFQLDSEEQITNIFWADPKMIIDYTQFGDVVSFDTTFRTNKECRPFGLFAGFNHHRGCTVFGAALLYDETVESFKWLFEVFAEAHGGKKPITIFTDQDKAMARALKKMWPQTWHRLCTWHLMQNGITHLGHMMKDGSHFLTNLKKCIYEYDVEDEFETALFNLLDEYDVKNNEWLQRIYGLKSQWARCYMKNTFTIGIRSTQLSESLNSDLKDYLKSTLDVVQFFKHFERVLNQKRGNELKAEFDARNKMPRLANSMSIVQKQVGELYTPVIFQLFQEEYNWMTVCTIISRTDGNPYIYFRVGIYEADCEYKVCCNPLQGIVACSCMKFETDGILCCHCLKVLDVLDIKRIPEYYILKRWTRGATNMVVNDSRGKEVEQDVNLDCTQRYRRICHELIQIAAEASNTVEGYELVKDTANELRLKLGDIRNPVDCLDMPILTDFSNDIYDGLRLKHKEKSKRGGRRLKSWVEKQGKGKKKSGGPSNSQRLQNQQPTTAPTPTHMMDNTDPSYMSFMDSISHISSQASAAHQLLDEDYI